MIEFEVRHFDVDFSESDGFTCEMQEEDEFRVDFGSEVGKQYHGPVTVTPSDEAQSLPTAGRLLEDDITVQPIPNNYGLITWDGRTITVS